VKQRQQAEKTEKLAKIREFEAQIDKSAKGFIRMTEFNYDMSELAFNFGLKLYNLQNHSEILEKLEPGTKLEVPEFLVDASYRNLFGVPKDLKKNLSIWQKRDAKEIIKVKISLANQLEHTEF
jgi:hypothetical protein